MRARSASATIRTSRHRPGASTISSIDGELLGAQQLDEPSRLDAPWRMQIDDVTVWADEAWKHVQLFTGDPLPDVARRSLAVEPMTCPPNAFQTGRT